MPVLFLPRAGKTGEGPAARRCGQTRRPRARGGSGVRGKGPGGLAGLIPGRSPARGGLGWLGHSGRRRRVVAALDRQSRGAAAVKRRGRSTNGPQRCPSLPWFGSRGSGEGGSAVAGGGNGKRR